jgi:hypothetical protein
MGSRSRRNSALSLAVVGLVSCTTGAPTGFSKGDQWTVPLVGPLEHGLLVVPAFVNNKGPYLFMIDPDSVVSSVDDRIVKEAGLRSGVGPHLLDEGDTERPLFYAEILSMQLGPLVVERKSAMIVKTGTYDADGRLIDGVLGRDVIADSLVFGFDRDAGTITLETQEAWKRAPVTGGASFHYDVLASLIENVRAQPVSRRILKADVDGEPFVMHVDFGAKSSQLRERSWAKAKLEAHPTKGTLVDEVATARQVTQLGKAASVSLGAMSTPNVMFVPYAEKRWNDEDLEGALGLDFFDPYKVWVNWDAQTVELLPRHEPTPADLATRQARWGVKALMTCAAPGCVTTNVIDPLANKPAEERPAQHPGVVVSFVRDPATAGTPLEVLVAAHAANGTPLATLVVSMPADADRAMTHLPGEYAGVTLTVLDVDPFPRACPAAGGCVDVLSPAT